ncbi:uncharacterized protein TRIADDRAFT_61588 [Trichoplax adhaerens]|uniref:PARP4 MVP-ID C-terminal domain-containing protein n=1 Tax=Trichoplax adhaerens TaxID=10228 RepID=B3SBE7_TRIAD|nr:predicted protein [Trichoplax adhaerens]EDV19940.1 predicted protein [Trichoplax adhaerens]|eukprot:XP_002117530.1 predicted protein [Trichoplax adhaerens]
MLYTAIPPPPSSLGPTPTLRSQHFRISKSRIASGPPPAQASQPCPPPPLPGSSASELFPPLSYSQSKTNEELLVQQIHKPKPSSSIEINKHKAKIEYQYASMNGAKEDIVEIEPNRAAKLGSLATSAKALKGFLRVGRQTNSFLSRTNFNSLGASADDHSNLAKEETLDDDKKVEYRQMKFRKSKALAKKYKSANTKDNLVDEPENPKEMKNLTYINCRELMMFQVSDGYWEVTPEIAAIIRISVEKLFRLLTEAGIYSLGSKACKDIVRMVFTKIVIVILGKIAQLQESLARATKWLVCKNFAYYVGQVYWRSLIKSIKGEVVAKNINLTYLFLKTELGNASLTQLQVCIQIENYIASICLFDNLLIVTTLSRATFI